MLSSTQPIVGKVGSITGGEAPDSGIDLVARCIDGGTWVAIQRKFYMPTARLPKANPLLILEAPRRSYTTVSGPIHFGSRIIQRPITGPLISEVFLAN